jgi:hypothetical protein
MNQELCFLNDDGEPCGATLFAPLVDTLLPAFVERAEEICITFSLVTWGQITATYNKGGKSFPLHIKTEFHPADVFARLRILANISIAATRGRHTGEAMMRFRGQRIKVSVEIIIEEAEEIIRLKPFWETHDNPK